MVILNGFIADLNQTIILMLAYAHCVVHFFQHVHRISSKIPIKMKIDRFLAFGSLISNAEEENAKIFGCIIVGLKSGI